MPKGDLMAELPEDLLKALEAGELTRSQLDDLIRLEAEALKLTYEEAVRLAREGSLPRGPIADDLEFLVELLPAAA